IRGQLVDAQDRGLRRAEVLCTDLGGRLLATATSDERGEWTMSVVVREGVPARFCVCVGEWRLPGEVDDHGFAWATRPIDPRNQPIIVLRCERTGAISGRATDDHGNVLAFAPVYLLQRAPEWASLPVCERRASTDRQGAFELRSVLPGEYSLVIHGDEGCFAR